MNCWNKENLEKVPGGSSQGTLWTLLASWFRDHHKGGPRLKPSQEIKEREFWIYCFDVKLDWGGRSREKIPRKGQGLFTPYSDATGGEDTKKLVIRIHTWTRAAIISQHSSPGAPKSTPCHHMQPNRLPKFGKEKETWHTSHASGHGHAQSKLYLWKVWRI